MGAPGSLRLATRGSPLALHQTELVAGALRAARAGLAVEVVVVRTRGDEDASSLDQIGGQGVFVTEVEAAVADGRADAAVHSAKDLTSVMAAGLVLAAVPPRADPRDGLVGAALADLPAGAPSAHPTSPSRASARGGTAASTRWSGSTEVMSLAECTAASARPSSSAASISLTKAPCPPMRSSGAVASRSPRVCTTTVVTPSPGCARCKRPATASVWRRASGEPRVARRNVSMR